MTNDQNRHRLSRRALIGGTATGAAALSLAHFQARANPAGPAPRALRAGGQNAGGTLVYGLGFDLDGTMDPQVTNYDSTIRVTLNICEPLVWMPSATEIVPGLAESWELSEDGTEYTFHLKQGVTFHDGTPFNAEAVQFTFDRVTANDRIAAGATPTADPVITPGQAHDQLGPYDHSEIIDDYTIKVVLKTAFAPFLTGLNGYLGIVSPTAVRTMGLDAFARAPVGTGPYIFKEWVEADHVTLSKNPDYNWGSSSFANQGAAYFDELEFKVIADASVRTGTVTSGETQYIDTIDPLQYEDLSSNGDVVVVKQPQPGSGYVLLLNLSRDTPIADPAVRQALHFAIDKDAFNQAVYGGLYEPAASPLMKVTFGYEPQTETLFTYDKDKAGQLLDAAGWMMNGDFREKDGQKLSLYWPVQEREPDKSQATFCQGAWREIGVDLTVDVMERGLLSQTIRDDNNYDVTTMWFSYADPDVLRTIFWSKNQDAFNRAKYNDPDVDSWLEQAYQSNDEATRKDLYSKIQMKVLNDGATIPLADSITYNAKAGNVQGEVLDFLASYVWLNSAYFE
jgi:peptide/nickel transport system substrate-binding protein